MNRHHQARVMALPDLVAALRDHAAGSHAHRAAVELVVDHGVFLGRSAFRQEFVGGAQCHPSCAYVRWGAAVAALNQQRLACSSSEADVLRIAASLGGDVPVRLRRVLGVLDATNIVRVTDAITVANGTQPHRCRSRTGN